MSAVTPEAAARLRRAAVGTVLLILAIAGVIQLTSSGPGTRTAVAYLPSAVSVYKGTDVRILGVTVGRVTRVVPDGDSVRVEIEYDDSYDVPKGAEALVIQPTLVADRFVQLSPAYTSGATLADGAVIPLPKTGVPVELDRVYGSLNDLSTALGPNGANSDGSLDRLLGSASNALRGRGAAGNQMIRELAALSTTFANGRGALFATISNLATVTQTLADNDTVVRNFIEDLTGVSAQLSGDRRELQQALRALATAVTSVEDFVGDNRTKLSEDVNRLTRTVRSIASQKDSLDQVLSSAGVSLGNLAVATDPLSGTTGSRFNFSGNINDADGFLCALVQQTPLPGVSRNLACQLLEKLIEPLVSGAPAAITLPEIGDKRGTSPGSTRPARATPASPAAPSTPTTPGTVAPGTTGGGDGLRSLLGGDA